MTTQPRKIKNTISVLVEGLYNNTIHVQQQTPVSNVKSPESPKHRKEKVMGWGGDDFHYIMRPFSGPGAVCSQNACIRVFSFHAARGQITQRGSLWDVNLIFHSIFTLACQCTTCCTSKTVRPSPPWPWRYKRVARNVFFTHFPDAFCPSCSWFWESRSW